MDPLGDGPHAPRAGDGRSRRPAAAPRRIAAGDAHPLQAETLRRVLAAIDDDLAAAHSVRDLAALTGLGPSRFSRCFKAATGLPPHRYLTHRRVARARELLAHGDPIAQVALSVGFFDQSHLDRHFKRLLHCAPRDVPRALP